MKPFYKIIPALFFLFSCTRDKTYQSFTEKELDFVNYSQGQTVRMIDTNNTMLSFVQDTIKREFREFIGVYGKTQNFHELFWVQYSSNINPPLGFSVSVSGKFYPYALGELGIRFENYLINVIVDSLKPPTPTLTIAGTTYSNVYSLKAYKYGSSPNNIDTARMYYNKQYGIIQFLFPDGKYIIRAN